MDLLLSLQGESLSQRIEIQESCVEFHLPLTPEYNLEAWVYFRKSNDVSGCGGGGVEIRRTVSRYLRETSWDEETDG